MNIDEIETATETATNEEPSEAPHRCNPNDRTWFGLCPECGERIEEF